MSSTLIRPRPDQVLELSRGLSLPLPSISNDHLEIIIETLFSAFRALQKEHPNTINSGTEAEVTALLEARLNFLAEKDPFWGQLVRCTVRGAESLSFDGSNLEKRPDLSIFLTERNRNFPLIAEAKLIDTSKGKTEKLYCDNGVMRFLNGEYAWGTTEAMMVAYVRDGSSISSKLTPFLKSGKPSNEAKYSVTSMPHHSSSSCNDVAVSEHNRTFSFSVKAPANDSPGPIKLWHIWLT